MERIERLESGVILYDASLVNHPQPPWFDAAHWLGAQRVTGGAGRGATLFIDCEGHACVLRHYWRGGQVARLTADRFVWLGEARTRSFAEFRLLQHIQTLGLPAPRPVAARYRRHGLSYTADLITLRLSGVESLAVRMLRETVSEGLWQAVGQCIAQFHTAGIYHADLNAHNIQIDGAGSVWLLDFDRGRVMRGAGGWRAANLQRLHRSLTRVSGQRGRPVPAAAWGALLEGYRRLQPA